MLPDNVDRLPFPRTLVFDDIEDVVLYAEFDAETTPESPAPWLDYMRRVLPEQLGA
jgi:hypothetical protein